MANSPLDRRAATLAFCWATGRTSDVEILEMATTHKPRAYYGALLATVAALLGSDAGKQREFLLLLGSAAGHGLGRAPRRDAFMTQLASD